MCWIWHQKQNIKQVESKLKKSAQPKKSIDWKGNLQMGENVYKSCI